MRCCRRSRRTATEDIECGETLTHHERKEKEKRGTHGKVGVLRLDYDYPPSPGDIDHPGSFNYKVIYRMVPGLTFEMCQAGVMTPEVEKHWESAVQWLVDQGVSFIIGDCGFMMFFQKRTRVLTGVPVALSALTQLPAITIGFAAHEKVAVFTANAASLDGMRGLWAEFGINTYGENAESKLIFVGCEDVPGFGAVAAGKRVDVQHVTPGIVSLAKDVVAKNPEVRAFLFECTELPQFSDAVRLATKLPVYDAITGANMVMTGFQDNPRFGVNDWQYSWDSEATDYCLGDNLTQEERSQCVSLRKIASDEHPSSLDEKLRKCPEVTVAICDDVSVTSLSSGSPQGARR
jgi:hypothetical protein